jgi:hypothetical protein
MATRWRSPPDRRVPRWPTRGVQAVTHTGPCQKFARNYATRNLAPPHNAALDSALHLRRCVGRKVGHGIVNHPHINGMQGVRGSNPLSSTTTTPQVIASPLI